MTLVGRCAALSVAAEARRRTRTRRVTGETTQPLRDFLAAETAALMATTVDDRVLTLEALRDHDTEAEQAATRRRELRRR